MSNYKLNFYFNDEIINEESYHKIVNPIFSIRAVENNILSFNVLNEDDIKDFANLDIYNLRIGIRND